MKFGGKPSIILIDDDPEFIKPLEAVLKKMGIVLLAYTDLTHFLEAIRTNIPDLYLVDLNLGQMTTGFDLVDLIRKERGNEVPIMVLSSDDDAKIVAQALQCGANDYMVKNFDTHWIASKLHRYIKSKKIVSFRNKFFPMPGGRVRANLTFDLQIKEIDEIGARLLGPHLFSTGTTLLLGGSMIQSISGREERVAAKVISNWTETEPSIFGAFAEFESTEEAFIQNVRRWLSGKQGLNE